MKWICFCCFWEKDPNTPHQNWGHATSKITLPAFECLCITKNIYLEKNQPVRGVVTICQWLFPNAIDHAALLCAVERCCGISRIVLKWFASYLTEICQSISDFIKVIFGVPQGFVLGPILFTLLTAPLSAIVSLHGLLCHLYADNSQLCIVFNPRDSLSRDEAVAKIKVCAEDIRKWITCTIWEHFRTFRTISASFKSLKLNNDKTELIIVTTRQMVFDAFSVTVRNNVIAPLPEPHIT
jgi:hypothetical protein